MTELERAMQWLGGRDTGLSSEAILGHMLGAPPGEMDHPHDPDDLSRCLRLLKFIPEWKPRMAEMACRGPFWRALVARWADLTTLFAAETGWELRGWRAPKTYALMGELLDEAIKTDPSFYDVRVTSDGRVTGWSRRTRPAPKPQSPEAPGDDGGAA